MPNKALQPTRSAVGHDFQQQRSVARLSLVRYMTWFKGVSKCKT
jgi:hypothetical protein